MKTALFFICGKFGKRWYRIALENGKNADQVTVPNGQGIFPELVEESLAGKQYRSGFCDH